MNHPGEDIYCCFHPREFIVGICAPCLNERLLILASKQGHQPKETHHLIPTRVSNKKPSFITIPKVFALSSFLHRLELRPQKPDSDDSTDRDSIPSLEDSFISIKFEDNGRESWDRKNGGNPKPLSSSSNYLETEEQNGKGGRSMVEHGKPRGTLRWRKRIGHLFQLVRWKRSAGKSNVCHVGFAAGNKVEGVKVRKGWIRSLTRRRTTTATQ